MKLILENWREYLEEISTEDLRAFGEKFKNSDNVEKLAARLAELGWDANAIKHHKEEEPPYAEIRHIILNLEKYVRSMNIQWYKSSHFHVLRRSVHIEDNRFFQEQSLK